MPEVSDILASSASPLSEELLEGAGAIAAFMFGDFEARRKVYNLVEQQRLPIFRLGKRICARKSTLQCWIVDQEKVCRAGYLAQAG